MALAVAPNHSQAGDRTAHATLRSYRLGDWQAMHALDLICFAPVFQFSRGAMRGFAEKHGARLGGLDLKSMVHEGHKY